MSEFFVLFVLFVLITIHELGHYLFAKLFNVRVEKFCVFLDPFGSLFEKKIRQTIFAVGYLPLGGYVKLNESDFDSLKAWKRFLIMAGGILANFALCFVVLFICAKSGHVEDGNIALKKIMEIKGNSVFVNTTNAFQFLFTCGFLSAFIGFINLIPIPPLDGGNLFIIFLEMMNNKLSNKTIKTLSVIGFILIVLYQIYCLF